METQSSFNFLSILVGVGVIFYLILLLLRLINKSPKIQRALNHEIWGYALYRWLPSLIVLILIFTHAIVSQTWWRVASGTKVTQGYEVPLDILRDARLPYFLTRDTHTHSDHLQTRRPIQLALDAERKGATRSDARGKITLPAPSVALNLAPTNDLDAAPKQHLFKCDFKRKNCIIKLQSMVNFTHIMISKNFVSRVLINEPVLTIQDTHNGVIINVTGISDPSILRSGEIYADENFSNDAARLETVDGKILPFFKLGLSFLSRADPQQGLLLLNQDFAPIVLTYTMDFSTSLARSLRYCGFSRSADIREGTVAEQSENKCTFEPGEVEIYTLSGCDPALGTCPSPDTTPLDDLRDHDFAPADLTTRTQMGFTGPQSDLMFEMANRLSGDSTSRGLIALPNRATIVKRIITDYLTVTGPLPVIPEFDRFLAANPDLDVQDFIAAIGYIPETLRQQSLAAALRRQPQLWAWHSYNAYIGEELITALMRDLVTMGLARPA